VLIGLGKRGGWSSDTEKGGKVVEELRTPLVIASLREGFRFQGRGILFHYFIPDSYLLNTLCGPIRVSSIRSLTRKGSAYGAHTVAIGSAGSSS